MPAPTVLPGRAFQQATRKSNLLLHWRAKDLVTSTVNGVAATFSRASSGGRVLAKGLPLDDSTEGLRLGADPSDNVPSWSFYPDENGVYVPALTLGRAYTNLVTSDNFDSGWTSGGTPVVTAGIDDPVGGAGAYRVADDDGATAEAKFFDPTFTGDGVKCVVAIVREATMPASGTQRVCYLYDLTAGTNRCAISITGWVNGSPTLSAVTGTVLGKQYIGNGYWAIFGQSTSVTAANNHRIYLYPAFTAAQTGSIDVYRVNAYNAAVPPPFVLDASVTRAADLMTLPFLAEPQPMTILYEGFVADLPNQGTSRALFVVGDAATQRLGVYFNGVADRLQILFHNGSAEVYGWFTSPGVSLGDRITVRVSLAADGAITAGFSLNGGAEDTTQDSAIPTQALPTGWASNRVRFGNLASGGVQVSNSVPAVFKIAAGVRSLAYMKEAY